MNPPVATGTTLVLATSTTELPAVSEKAVLNNEMKVVCSGLTRREDLRATRPAGDTTISTYIFNWLAHTKL